MDAKRDDLDRFPVTDPDLTQEQREQRFNRKLRLQAQGQHLAEAYAAGTCGCGEGGMTDLRHIIPISGKDSCATAIVQKEIDPPLDYEYIFNETGLELPPVYEWLDKVSAYLVKPITRFGDDLLALSEKFGILPSQQMRFCTKYCKIFPTRDYLGKEPANIYYGLRADESDRVGHNGAGFVNPVYPLRQLNIGLPGVWKLLEDRDLLPPAFLWPEMIERVKAKMPEEYYQSSVDLLPPWDYQHLFSWRIRQFNCAACIFMRQYEFIALHEFYPDTFWLAVEWEESTGSDEFTLRDGYRLRDLLGRAEEVKERRTKQIVKILYKLIQTNILEDHRDLLSITSCGLLCGK